MATIITPRPPLNLFEVVRQEVTADWATLYDVPEYLIPANGPNPQRTVRAAAIMTGIVFSPSTQGGANVSVRILDAEENAFPVITDAYVPSDDFLSISLDRQVLLTGEQIQIRCQTGQSVVAHFSFILNQREEFEVIT